MQYVSATEREEGCVFCNRLEMDDEGKALILYRGEGMFVVLNAFPYNSGHLMILPLRHVGDIGDLDEHERGELMTVTHKATEALREAMSPEGFNIGMNLGSAGGAGIPDHLHMHVVPRWGGDTNYMTTIGDAKVLPEMLADTYRKLRPLL
jgi:ATP adenylyltransferase